MRTSSYVARRRMRTGVKARTDQSICCTQHDAQLDYYGKRLATCSSDRTVKVFDVVDGETQRTSGHTLKG